MKITNATSFNSNHSAPVSKSDSTALKDRVSLFMGTSLNWIKHHWVAIGTTAAALTAIGLAVRYHSHPSPAEINEWNNNFCSDHVAYHNNPSCVFGSWNKNACKVLDNCSSKGPLQDLNTINIFEQAQGFLQKKIAEQPEIASEFKWFEHEGKKWPLIKMDYYVQPLTSLREKDGVHVCVPRSVFSRFRECERDYYFRVTLRRPFEHPSNQEECLLADTRYNSEFCQIQLIPTECTESIPEWEKQTKRFVQLVENKPKIVEEAMQQAKRFGWQCNRALTEKI